MDNLSDEEFVYEIAPELVEIHEQLQRVRKNYGTRRLTRAELKSIIEDVLIKGE